jgi:hypothetical protein
VYIREEEGASGGSVHPAYAGCSLAEFSTLEMEAIYFSETSVHTRSSQRHIFIVTAVKSQILHMNILCERNIEFQYVETGGIHV